MDMFSHSCRYNLVNVQWVMIICWIKMKSIRNQELKTT